QMATYFGWPVSTTHAIVGAIVGFGILYGGVHAIHWQKVGWIIVGWIVAPVVSAMASWALYSALDAKILDAGNPERAARNAAPTIAGVVLATLTLLVMLSSRLNDDGSLGTMYTAGLSIVVAGVVAVIGAV